MGQSENRRKKKSQEFWCDPLQAMLGAVHSKAPHTQSHLSACRALLSSFVLQLGT